jgi:hypothetical protein
MLTTKAEKEIRNWARDKALNPAAGEVLINAASRSTQSG